MATTYIVVIVGVLVVLNVYPVFVSQNFIFRSKQDSMLTRAALYSSPLSGQEELQTEAVARIVELLDDGAGGRVIVTDTALRVVYDSSEAANSVGKILFLNEVRAALDGKDYFHADYSGDALGCVAAMPIMSSGYIIGAVCLYDTDTTQPILLSDIMRNLWSMSLLILAASVLLALLLSRIFSRRISKLLGAIRRAHEGDYKARDVVRGGDELAELAVELDEMTDKLARVEDMRRRFVSDASHELKTPLASIKLLVDSIVQNDNMPTETVREFARDVGEETERLSRLTEKLLNITRLDATEAERLTAVDLALIARRVVRTLSPLAERDGVTLKLSLMEGCTITATADGAYQIIFNLAENAIKYNVRGGTVGIFLFRNEEGVTLIVDDTGIGIPEVDVPRVFDRFYRVDKARSREQGGSGLGLAIVEAAVHRYGGTIHIESKQGKGTRVTAVFSEVRP